MEKKIYKNKFYLFLKLFLITILIIKFIDLFFLGKNKIILNILNKNVKTKILSKLCFCAIGKYENKYIRELIEYYIKFGVDKIYLYDNNNIDGERFEEVIEDYIMKGLVKVFNWRGIKRAQHSFMNDCYLKYYKVYDWLIYYDLDEFIYLNNYTNIKDFLNEKKFKNCQVICLNLFEHTDNDLLFYEDKPLFQRFKELENLTKKGKRLPSVKPILRGHIPNIKMYHIHTLSDNLKICNGFGHKNKVINNLKAKEPDYKYFYIHHFYSKSTEEFINKLKRGDALYINSKLRKINKYFRLNKITKEKIDMIEKGIGLNLSRFKKKIN